MVYITTEIEQQLRRIDAQLGMNQETSGDPELIPPLEAAPDEEAGISSELIIQCLDQNEDGDAKLLIQSQRGLFTYDHYEECWYRYTGHYWEEDILKGAIEAIESVIGLYAREAKRQAWNWVKCEKAGKRDEAGKHRDQTEWLLRRIRALQTKARKENVLFLARSGPNSLGITGQEWDTDPWLLACPNGVVDLRTGEHRPGKPGDFIRTYTPVEWKGLHEPAPTWEKFLSDIHDGNIDVIKYVQRLSGYALTGRTTDHVLPFFVGQGRNGKGTYVETIGYVTGPYSGQIESEMILKQKEGRRSGSATSDIMALRGKRFVWGSEIDEGRGLNAGRVKWLIWGDTMTGREVYGKRQISFTPTHKIFVLTNHKPSCNADDYALFNRIHIVSFPLSFVDEPTLPNERKRDPMLLDKLKEESPGILAWLVRGCLAWQEEGLNPPVSVKMATDEYREEQDWIQIFLDHCTEMDKKSEVQHGVLYACYRAWCGDNDIKAVGTIKFGKTMKKKVAWHDKDNKPVYLGIKVTPWDENEGEQS